MESVRSGHASAQPAEVTETQRLKSRINEAMTDISRSRRRVAEIADRLFGSRAEKEGPKKPEPVPAGEIESLHYALGALGEQLVFLDEEITRISSLA